MTIKRILCATLCAGFGLFSATTAMSAPPPSRPAFGWHHPGPRMHHPHGFYRPAPRHHRYYHHSSERGQQKRFVRERLSGVKPKKGITPMCVPARPGGPRFRQNKNVCFSSFLVVIPYLKRESIHYFSRFFLAFFLGFIRNFFGVFPLDFSPNLRSCVRTESLKRSNFVVFSKRI